MAFTDRDGNPVDVPEPPPAGSHYAAIGAFQAGAYARNAFAKGTAQEAAALAQVLQLRPGMTVLDVGCGSGRHVAELRRTHPGVTVLGVDLSPAVLAGGPAADRVAAADSRRLPIRSHSVDALYSVCQGGFGLTPAGDVTVVKEWCRVLRKGGRAALTAFSLVFAVRWMGPDEAIDIERGLHHHLAEVRGGDGETRRFDLWTRAYTAAHLRDLLGSQGLRVLGVAGADVGAYRLDVAPTLADPELLVWAERR